MNRGWSIRSLPLRLDCWAGNTFLIGFYAGAGLVPMGTAIEGDFEVMRFESPLPMR